MGEKGTSLAILQWWRNKIYKNGNVYFIKLLKEWRESRVGNKNHGEVPIVNMTLGGIIWLGNKL
jgi:hypothetical protein